MIPWGYIGLGGALVATLVGAWIHDLRREAAHSHEVTKLNQIIQDWKDAHGQLEAAVAKQREDQLAQRLAEEQKRIENDAKQRDEQARLRRLAAEQQVIAKQLGEELLRRLEATPKTPESKLDAGVRDYYRELREQQCAASRAAGRAATGGATC